MKSVVPARSCRQAWDPWAFNRRPRILLGAIVWKNDRAPIAATIVVDKPAHNVRAYDREGRLLGYYPATMGSEEKPAPSGVFACMVYSRYAGWACYAPHWGHSPPPGRKSPR